VWVEKHGPTWRIREERGGKSVVVQSGFDTKTAAKNVMTTLKADKLRRQFVDPRAGKIKMNELFDRWWPVYEQTLKPSAMKSEGSRLRCHLRPDLGDLRLEEFDGPADQWWVSQMISDGMAAKSIRNCHGLLFVVMEFAILHKMIGANPCQGTKMPELVPREMRFLTEVEGANLVAGFKPEWQAVPITMLGTGIRWAELAGLKVGRVDILGRKIRIEDTLQFIGGDGLVTVQPKTRASRRTISLPIQVAEALVPLVQGKRRADYVFTTPEGEPLSHHWFWYHVWEPSRTAADLEEVRIHDLRHTHASWLIAANRPLTGIQRRLGHTSIAITSDLYGHLLPDVDEGIVAALEKALSCGRVVGGMGLEQSGVTRNSPEIHAGQTA
jgi:integrase